MTGEINFEVVLDRIIEMTEKNLTMQSEFIRSIQELKNKYENTERDHADIKKLSDIMVNNIYEIINKMNIASNDKIIVLLEEMKEKRNAEYLITENNKRLLEEIKIRHCAADPVAIKEIADSYKMTKKVLGVIALLVLGFQLIAGMFYTVFQSSRQEELKKQIQTIMKGK